MTKVRLGTRRGMQEVVIPVDAALARDATRLLGEILQFLFTSSPKPESVKWGDDVFARVE